MKLWILLSIIINVSSGYAIPNDEPILRTLEDKLDLKSKLENSRLPFNFYARIPTAVQLLKRYMDGVIERSKLRQKKIEQEKRDRIFRIYLAGRKTKNLLNDFLPSRYF